ncbi:LDL receptor repeat-containing protein egg-1-like [Ptychodera flava]|uniref:LDL receptor repeat-containing protein egg-1-like n=1 Tax=Ptychodera flava TaxID=63121 RepID=UPI003969F839
MVRQLIFLVALFAMAALSNALSADLCDLIGDDDKFTCVDPKGGDPCLMKRFECDGIADCGDGSDEGCSPEEQEANCDRDYREKGLKFFQCVDTKMCMDTCRECDGVCDCLDKSDEANCDGKPKGGCDIPAQVNLC